MRFFLVPFWGFAAKGMEFFQRSGEGASFLSLPQPHSGRMVRFQRREERAAFLSLSELFAAELKDGALSEE